MILCGQRFESVFQIFSSPDSGITVHWLISFSGNSTITVFTTSLFDGTFAFLTDSQEVRFDQHSLISCSDLSSRGYFRKRRKNSFKFQSSALKNCSSSHQPFKS